MTIEQWIMLVSAAGAVLGGIASLIHALRGIRKSKKRSNDKLEGKQMKHKVVIWIVLSGVCLITGVGFGAALTAGIGAEPLNVQLTKAAWDAFNDRKYDEAVLKADNCIKEFEGQALLEQGKLETEKAPQPPDGAVSKEGAERIHKSGLLNDVATCFFVKGRALEEQHRYSQARTAYEKAAGLSYGRTWDPKGWFWSPAQASEGRLKTLPKDTEPPAPKPVSQTRGSEVLEGGKKAPER